MLRHWLAIARSKESPSPIFRSACAEIGRLLLYEATNNWLPTLDVAIETPVGTAPSTVVDPTRPVKVLSFWAARQMRIYGRALTGVLCSSYPSLGRG